MSKQSTIEFLSELDQLGIKLSLAPNGENLNLKASKEVLTQERLKAISGRKAEIITLLRHIQQDTSDAPAIQPVAHDKPLPLSFAQQRLWFLSQLEGASVAYNLTNALRLQGNLNEPALNKCLNEIVNRHEILRTTFAMGPNGPQQTIHPPTSLFLPLTDLSQLPASEQETEVQKRIEIETQTSFDLEHGPLLRAQLLHLAPDNHILLVSIHHIVADGWSFGVLVEEFSALYEAFVAGQPSPLPPLTIQYGDFAQWQQHQFSDEVIKGHVDYWTNALAGAPELLRLPTDYARPLFESFRGGQLTFTLDKSTTNQLKSLSQRAETTLFMTMLAVLKVLCFRYSGQEDLVIGTGIANRNRPEIEPLIGFFVNTLAIRSDMSGNPSFRELLAQVRQTTLEAMEHQDFPFEKVVDALHTERHLNYSPIFQVMLMDQNFPDSELTMPGLTLTPLEVEMNTAKFDLVVLSGESADGLRVIFEYNTDLFMPATMQRMAEHFQILLMGIVANPDQSILELPLLSETERQTLLVDWNQPAPTIDSTTNSCLHHLFEAQVKHAPDAPAIRFEGQTLTYNQLNQQANQLAHYLIRQGVRADTLVGLCLSRSPEMVIGILAILKAGGAYLPLDPTYPAERLDFMLQDADIQFLLTQQEHLDTLSSYTNFRLCLDTEWNSLAPQPNTNPSVPLSGQNLAYVIYTSGSTGKPKGALISHFNVVRLFSQTRPWFNFDHHDVWTLFHSISFDFSVWELWGALLYGGKLVIVPYLVSRSPQDFYALLLQEQVTVLNQTPSAFMQLIPIVEASSNLRYVIFGGEALHLAALESWFARHGDQQPQLVNMYGITETTVHVTYRPLSNADTALSGSMIGQRIPDLQLYILNDRFQPCPIGVPGEIFVGGGGVSRGYLNRPDLTQERFVPLATLPFSTGNAHLPVEDNATLYRTGDLARFLTNGDIEYLGRIDHQVKVRGFRIELGEIEAVLSTHPQVSEVLVLAKSEGLANHQLLAYVVASQPDALQPGDLRSFAQQSLPDYMVPAAFVILGQFPLTPNGKIDRRALPDPDQSSVEQQSYTPPRTPVETTLCHIWREILHVEQVGIHDNFFEMGGDSILCIQIITRARDAGLNMNVRQVFQHQTIAELAPLVTTTLTIQAEQGLVTGPLPLTPIQHWFFEQKQSEPHHFNQAIMVTIAADTEPDAINSALLHLLQHHDALRLRFEQVDGFWRQDILDWVDGDAASLTSVFQPVDLAALPPQEQTAQIEKIAADLQASFDLSQGYLLRAALFQLGPDRPARLLLILHHLLVDGVSWRILLDDLETIVNQLRQAQTVQLPAKTTSYKEWANRLSEYAQSEALLAELAYWSQPDNLPLPRDFPDGLNLADSSATVTVSLSSEETKALLQQAPQAYNTQINDLLLTALVQSLSRWIGSPNVQLYLEGHGREELFEDVDLSRTVGWFTTIFPITLTLSQTDSAAAIKAIKEQLRQVPQRGIGYGLLRYLNPHIQFASASAPQVSFNYLGQLDASAAGNGLVLDVAPEDIGPANSSQGLRPVLLDINGQVTANKLEFSWAYSQNIHTKATISALARNFIDALRQLIDHCLQPTVGGYTPSDFPQAHINQAELDMLLDSMGPFGHKNIEAIYPLSPLQQGLLFHTIYEPDAAVYRVQLGYTLRGPLNTTAFRQAWQTVMERHQILRTFFLWDERETPLQVVCRHLELPWSEFDWQDEPDQATRLQAFLKTDQNAPLDLQQPPVMRFSLLKVAPEQYHFIWIQHHILLDGWSLPIIFKEVFELYQAALSQQTFSLPPAPRYQDYIAWLYRQDLAEAETFWRNLLADFSAPTPLVVDRKAEGQTKGYRTYRRELPEELTAALNHLARQYQLTLNTLIQGAWGILLHRYSGLDDVVFGNGVSGRSISLPNIEELVGILVNTLPSRMQITHQSPVINLLKTLQEQQVQQREYAYTPLVEIQRWSEVPGDAALFETGIAFENYPVDQSLLEPNALQAEVLSVFQPTHFPLGLLVGPGKRLQLDFEYDTSRFADEVVTRWADHYQTLLSSIVENPHQAVADLAMLSPAETNQLLIKANATAQEYRQAAGKCMHHLIEAQAAASPTAIALEFEGQCLTYAQLNQRANQLAHYLQQQGVGPEVLVGICLERSLDMVIGLLAILKAGGAYLPLDPNYPANRLTYMIEDAELSLVLSQSSLAPIWQAQQQTQVIMLDEIWDDITQHSDENPVSGVTPHNLAYTIYTSGSTGQPKGVLVTHHSLCNLALNQMNLFHIEPDSRLLQFHSLNFDPATADIMMTLCAGATLVLASKEAVLPGDNLERTLREGKISHVEVPGLVLSTLTADNLPDLKVITVGGEPITADLVKQWAVGRRFFNAYGPTETCVCVTAAECDQNVQNPPPIGRPLPNNQIYILDKQLRPVPAGVPGELYVGGTGLARCYHNQPAATAEKFIPNPFYSAQSAANDEQGSVNSLRLYKTGDLARYLPHGDIEFLGRADHQIKLRGFRIELGEIESVLARHVQVRDAVVVVHEPQQNGHITSAGKRLVAYVVPKQIEEESSQWQSEYIDQWQSLYNQTYNQLSTDQDLTFNIMGWNSSYTGQPIPAPEMREWVDQTVARIRGLQPDSVLEIGCGTGLLLSQIAPHISQYWGTDFSREVLDYVEVMKQQVPGLSHVKLLHRLADNFESIPAASFDLVILNSVVQYFPSIDYLADVLGKAITAIKPGGAIFLGDVRHLGLLETYHTSIQLHNAPSDSGRNQLEQAIQERMMAEEELVIAPDFFSALQTAFPQISVVQIQPKRAKYHNELSRFRYDVVLHIGQTPTISNTDPLWLDWQKEKLTLPRLTRILQQNKGQAIGVRRIPNARLAHEVKTLHWLSLDKAETVGQWRKKLATTPQDSCDPEDIWNLVDKLDDDSPYNIALSWLNSDREGRFDAFFVPPGVEAIAMFALTQPKTRPAKKGWQTYANHPLQSEINRRLIPQLRQHLQAQLPEHMVPNLFIPLPSMPLSPTGKINRHALPNPDTFHGQQLENYVAPRTLVETELTAIWERVLGLEQVGIHDNFFELGGHSLLATQVASRIRKALQIDVPLRLLFENATVAGLAQKIANENEAELAGTASPPASIVPADRRGEIPLSFAQQRLWFLSQFEGANVAYNMPGALRLDGDLNQPALEQSLSEIIRRHEILRTTFSRGTSGPIQIIHPAQPVKLLLVQLNHLSSAEQTIELEQRLQHEATTPFDLETGPLFRMSLLQLNPESHVLLMNMHHIIGDGWSQGVFVEEFSTLYRAFANGESSPLPELTIQYADFANWQQSWLTAEVIADEVAYWVEQLAGAPPVLELPTDHARPAVERFRGRQLTFELGPEVTHQLQRLSQQENATMFMMLLAAFNVLFWRYSGQEDIVLGAGIANRNRPELEPLMGFFVNTLAIRSSLAGNPAFRNLLAQVRNVTLEAMEHQDLPFEKVVEAVRQPRTLNHSPIFQVLLMFQNFPNATLELPGLTLNPVEVSAQTAKFDLLLLIDQSESGLSITVEYNTDLFETDTIRRLGHHIDTLLHSIATNPDQAIGQLSLLSDREQQQLLAWGGGVVEPEADTAMQSSTSHFAVSTLQQLFEAQVAQTPNTEAVKFAGQSLTYAELNKRANQLAHYLRSQGVGPDVLVGLCIERSIYLVLGVLGIIKAGGAYVPLDPAYPKERLAFMLADTGTDLLLTSTQLLVDFPEMETIAQQQRLIRLDTDWSEIAQAATVNPSNLVCDDNLAYIIYTSGSTGQPKSVAMRHQPLFSLISWQLENTVCTAASKTLQFSPISFDVSFQELFATWCGGGTLVLVSEQIRREPGDLLKFMDTEAIERLFLPFVALQQLAEAAERGTVPGSLREVLTAGEQLQITPALAYFCQQTGCTLVNQYGPSESHVVTAYTLSGDAASWPSLPPIGRPVAAAQTYILDQFYQLVPVGVPGDLYLGGNCLARGYLNRPALTAERFIPHNNFQPISDQQHCTRLYKTGDLARYLADGNIEFLGRRDSQVKVRGFRIELGEIEVALTTHPAVKEAAVTVQEETSGHKRLVAYVVSHSGLEIPGPASLRDHLAATLPDYMLPAAYVALANMPLTPSGKINRRVLPAPDSAALATRPYVAPRTPIETMLADIWADVLQVAQVGMQDNFFDLGGYSLLAVNLIGEIEDRFTKKLPVASLFQAPTIEQFAPLLMEAPFKQAWSPLIPIQEGGNKTPFFCVPGVGSVYYLYELAAHLGADQPLYGLEAPGLHDDTPILDKMTDLTNYFIEVMQQVQPHGPYIVGGHSVGGVVAFAIALELQRRGQSVPLVIIFDTTAPSAWEDAEGEALDVVIYAKVMKDLLGNELDISIEHLESLKGEAQWQYVTEAFRKRYPLAHQAGVEGFKKMMDVGQSTIKAVHHYQAPEAYQGQLVLFEAPEGKDPGIDMATSWRAICQNPVKTYTLSGNHFTMMVDPHVAKVARQFNQVIKEIIKP